MGGIADSLGFGGGGDDAADASREAAETTAQYQQKALQYLKQKERLPIKFRDKALRAQNRFYLSPKGQQRFIDKTMASPFYQQNVQAGEEAIGRNLAMTGGLRSGTANEALAQNSQQVLQDLVNQRLAGIQGLAGTPTQTANIAQMQSNIGQTLGQGIVAGAQAQQAGQAAGMGNMMGLAQLGMNAYKTFSDIRLKTNIEKIGEANGINIYRWDWNNLAAELGLSGEQTGVIAQELQQSHPERISERSGYLTVNYEGLFNGL